MTIPIRARRAGEAIPRGLLLVSIAVFGWSLLASERLVAQGPDSVATAMTNALDERDAMPAALGSLWRYEGPTNLKQGVADSAIGISPYAGRINEVAVFPGNPQIMYATGPTGGVWKTVDGGITWASRSQGQAWRHQNATAVAVDPTNANRVFVGTGDYKRVDNVPPYSVGIMRSLDGGLTWLRSGDSEMGAFTVSRIVIDPGDPQNILAATGHGSRLPGGRIFRSANGGVSWAPAKDALGNLLPDANWDDLERCGARFWASATLRSDPDQPGGNFPRGHLYKSSDAGVTWTGVHLVATGFDMEETPDKLVDTIHIGCQAGSSNVYVAVYDAGVARVFFTTNSGSTWSEIATAPGNYPVPVEIRNWAHAAFAVTPGFLYVAGVDMFLGKLDATSRFVFSPLGRGEERPHNDFQCAIPDPTDADAVFLCSDGGLYRHSGSTGKTTSLNKSLGVTQVYRMDVHERDGGLIAFGAQDIGDAVSFFGNGTDAAALRKPPVWGGVLIGDGRSAAFRQDATARVYLANTTEVARYDGGPAKTFLIDDNFGGSQGPLLYKADVLYWARDESRRLPSPESPGVTPASWIPSALPVAERTQALAVCATDSQKMYAASVTGRLAYSTNAGQGWMPFDRTLLPHEPVWAISPSPANCSDVLLAYGYYDAEVRNGNDDFRAGDHLFHKADILAPGAWAGVHGGPATLPHAPLYAIVREPSAPDRNWWVAGTVGVFRTTNGGVSWSNATLPLGLPNTAVTDLRMSADGTALYAGTFGRGIWSMDVGQPNGEFGVRGTVTQAGRPENGIPVNISGPGVIKRNLKNKLTSEAFATTAPIVVAESATISTGGAQLIASDAAGVSLVTPEGSVLPMSPVFGGRTFILTGQNASALVGKQSKGSWSFNVTGRLTAIGRIPATVESAFINLEFQNGASGVTGPDGEFTLEYLGRGAHTASVPNRLCAFNQACVSTLDLQSHQTGINFVLFSVGEFTLAPTAATVAVHERLDYAFSWSVPEPLNWHDLRSLQLRVRDDAETIFSMLFDEATNSFSLFDEDAKKRERSYAPGSPNRLESPQATFYLHDAKVVGSGPTGPSVAVTLPMSFKPQAAGRTFVVEVAALGDDGNSERFTPAGTLTVLPMR